MIEKEYRDLDLSLHNYEMNNFENFYAFVRSLHGYFIAVLLLKVVGGSLSFDARFCALKPL